MGEKGKRERGEKGERKKWERKGKEIGERKGRESKRDIKKSCCGLILL